MRHTGDDMAAQMEVVLVSVSFPRGERSSSRD